MEQLTFLNTLCPEFVPDLGSYDHVIVAFSGGKDSSACVLYLLEQAIPIHKIELWHHLVDGREGSTLMDWPVTADYCRKYATAFSFPLYFSWLEGGFEREMNRLNHPKSPTWFESPEGLYQVGGSGTPGTRQRFPQPTSNLNVRWCSAYLKIDVFDIALRNQVRFEGKRILVVTGERAEESPGRAKYLPFTIHRSDARSGKKKRHVDHWRPIHSWSTREVWEIIQRWKVNPHPAYNLGWGRVSCAGCIFANSHQWASLRHIAPEQFQGIARYEEQFDVTIKQGETVLAMADRGGIYTMNHEHITQAVSTTFDAPIILESWTMPAGAFGQQSGPT